MRAIKKKVSLILAGLMVAGAAATMPVKAEGGAMPPAPKFVMARAAVNAGDQPKVLITTDFEEDVQYKVWYKDVEGNWSSTDYSEAVDGRIPFAVELPTEVAKGENCVSVWVKRASVDQKDCKVVKAEGGYDVHGYYFFNGYEKGYATGNIDYTIDGTNVTVNGVKDLASTAKFLVNYIRIGENGYNPSVNKWQTVGEYTTEAQKFELEPGYYYLNVHVNDTEYQREGASVDSWDAYRMDIIKVEEKAGKTVSFTTEVEALTIGANLTVSTESTDVATYKVFKGEEQLTYDAVAVNETAEDLFPAPKAGDAVTVKFYDANNVEVGSADVKLGEAGTITIEEKEMKEYTVEATVEALTIGANVTVTCDDADVDSYKVFKDGEQVTYDAVKIGEAAADLFPAPKAGDEVIVKLFDANGVFLGETTTTLK